MMAWVLLVACVHEAAEPDGDPTEEPVEDTSLDYTPPTWQGDGLPDPEDTDRDDGRDDQPEPFDSSDTGGTGDDTAPIALMPVADLLITSFPNFVLLGLFPEPVTCEAWLSTGTPYGVTASLPSLAVGVPRRVSGSLFWGDTFTYAEGWVELLSADPHYVEARWEIEGTAPGQLRGYNCGDALPWLPPELMP
jgi:hypothetical protein